MAAAAGSSAVPAGVVYLSRIPPRMKPHRLRALLERHAEVARVYLRPQVEGKGGRPAEKARAKKKKAEAKGTNRTFAEGWVEFARRKDAKRVAETLNMQPMGGRRRSAHFEDLWTIKYLKGFTWDELSAAQAYRSRAREQRIAAEVAAAKAERDAFAEAVRRGKAEAAMAERRAKKRKETEGGGGSDDAKRDAKVLRTFAQRSATAPQSEDARFGGQASKKARGAVGGNVSKSLLARMFE